MLVGHVEEFPCFQDAKNFFIVWISEYLPSVGTFLRAVEAVDFALIDSQVNKVAFYYMKAHLQQYFSNTVCTIKMSISRLCLNVGIVKI